MIPRLYSAPQDSLPGQLVPPISQTYSGRRVTEETGDTSSPKFNFKQIKNLLEEEITIEKFSEQLKALQTGSERNVDGAGHSLNAAASKAIEEHTKTPPRLPLAATEGIKSADLLSLSKLIPDHQKKLKPYKLFVSELRPVTLNNLTRSRLRVKDEGHSVYCTDPHNYPNESPKSFTHGLASVAMSRAPLLPDSRYCMEFDISTSPSTFQLGIMDADTNYVICGLRFSVVSKQYDEVHGDNPCKLDAVPDPPIRYFTWTHVADGACSPTSESSQQMGGRKQCLASSGPCEKMCEERIPPLYDSMQLINRPLTTIGVTCDLSDLCLVSYYCANTDALLFTCCGAWCRERREIRAFVALDGETGGEVGIVTDPEPYHTYLL